jgi:hypothetical protein
MPEGMNLEVAHTEYRNPRLEEAQRLNDRVSTTFDEGTEAARPPTGTCG